MYLSTGFSVLIQNSSSCLILITLCSIYITFVVTINFSVVTSVNDIFVLTPKPSNTNSPFFLFKKEVPNCTSWYVCIHYSLLMLI